MHTHYVLWLASQGPGEKASSLRACVGMYEEGFLLPVTYYLVALRSMCAIILHWSDHGRGTSGSWELGRGVVTSSSVDGRDGLF